MAKIIVSEFVTLDGVVESPEKWSLAYWNDEIAAFKHEELFSATALLLGRVTYDGFVAAWPGRQGSNDYADRINAMPKHVASSTLRDATWNATVMADAVSGVRALKESTEGDLIVFGSRTLVGALLAAGLVDELRLLTYPIARGNGARLFPEGETTKLELVEARAMKQAVLLVYRSKTNVVAKAA